MQQKLFAILSTLLFAWPVTAWANPSSRNINVPLAAHGTVPGASELAQRLGQLATEVEAFLATAEANVAKRGGAAAAAKQLASFRGRTAMGLAEARRLAIMGEPISVDLEMRLLPARDRVQALQRSFMATPQGNALRLKILDQLRKGLPAREKKFASIREMVSKGQIDQAESMMDAMALELESTIHFVSSEEFRPHLGSYEATWSVVDTAASVHRRKLASQAMSEALAMNQVDLAGFESWVQSLVQQLKTSGRAMIESESGEPTEGTGPACIAALIARGQTLHARIQRNLGLRWAMAESSSKPMDQMTKLAGDLQAALANAAAQIVLADTASVPTSEVPDRHASYLAEYYRLHRLGGWKNGIRELDEALSQLVQKNSSYAAEVEQYERATRDVLVFQSRIANQATRALEKNFPRADDVVRQHSKVGPQGPGLYPQQTNAPFFATLMYPSNKTMAAVASQLVKQPVHVKHTLRPSADAKVASASLDARTFASVLAINVPTPEIDIISSRLLIDESHPPLTFAAYRALESLRRGDFEMVGGEVASCQMEAVVTRFASLPDSGSVLLPLGSAGTLANPSMQLNQMLMRVDIIPKWAKHPTGIIRP